MPDTQQGKLMPNIIGSPRGSGADGWKLLADEMNKRGLLLRTIKSPPPELAFVKWSESGKLTSLILSHPNKFTLKECDHERD